MCMRVYAYSHLLIVWQVCAPIVYVCVHVCVRVCVCLSVCHATYLYISGAQK